MAKKQVPKEKIEAVKKIANEMKTAKTIMVVSIKGLPSNQLQKIKKDIRTKANIQVAKKTALVRAIDETGISDIQKLKEYIQEDYAVLISNDDGFELTGWFGENRNPIAAKEGQVAEADIIVEEGPTDLVPGPVISELGAVGLQIMVEEGKITIRKTKAVIKKGEKVSGAAASIFQKLGIKPFMIGITPIAFYDAPSKKIFADVKIDKKAKLEELLYARAKAFAFAVSRAYVSKDTMGMLLAKASGQANALNKLQNQNKP